MQETKITDIKIPFKSIVILSIQWFAAIIIAYIVIFLPIFIIGALF
jgi:hypothetical protein